MLKNFFVVAWRQFYRNLFYSSINLLGFAIGLAVCLIISFYVYDELSFDHHFQDKHQIYRLLTVDNTASASGRVYAITSGLLSEAAVNEIPEVLYATRLGGGGQFPLRLADIDSTADPEAVVQLRILTADSFFFDVFTMNWIYGDPTTALRRPGSYIITESKSREIFGDINPVGKPAVTPGNPDGHIAGVIKDQPVNSHLQFDVITPLIINEQLEVWWRSWDNIAGSAYFKLVEGADPREVEEKLEKIGHSNGFAKVFMPRLQALLDIHLGSADFKYDFTNFSKNDRVRIYALALVAILVLLIATVNFINLSTARAAKRAREVGMRKVVGADRVQVAWQFLGESILITLVAMFIAMIAAEIALPALSPHVGKNLSVGFLHRPLLSLALFGGAALVGLLSGAYPALVLSGFRPIVVLKGDFRFGRQGVLLRQFLVVGQFAITIGLILVVLSVMAQIRYLRNVDMGYTRAQVYAIPTFNQVVGPHRDAFADKLLTLPGVESLGSSFQLPTFGGDMLRIECVPEGMDRETQAIMFKQAVIDQDFFPTLQGEISAGRNFSNDFSADTTDGILINETAARTMGWDDPIGKRLDLIQVDTSVDPKRVIGVFKDIHFGNARQAEEPMLMLYNTERCGWLVVRIRGGMIPETVQQIEESFHEMFPDLEQFNGNFLDDYFNFQFQGDRQFATAMSVFTGLAILIACLGLFGLAAYAVQQRRREIAIRKTLGAGESRLVSMLAFDFVKWVLLANLIAWPVGYYAVQKWLEAFIYRMPFSPWPYLLSGVGAMVIAMLTVLIQSIRASRTSPAMVLRRDS